MDLRLADDIYTEHLKPPEKRDEHEILIDLEERVDEIQEENSDKRTRDTKAVLRAVMRDLDELDATDEEENAHKPTREKEAVMGKVLKALQDTNAKVQKKKADTTARESKTVLTAPENTNVKIKEKTVKKQKQKTITRTGLEKINIPAQERNVNHSTQTGITNTDDKVLNNPDEHVAQTTSVVVKFRRIIMGKPLEQQLKANLKMFQNRKNNKKSKQKILHRYSEEKRK